MRWNPDGTAHPTALRPHRSVQLTAVTGWFWPLTTMPQLVVPAAGMTALYDSFTAVTRAPVCVVAAFQELATRCVPAKVNATVQPVDALLLSLRTVTAAW